MCKVQGRHRLRLGSNGILFIRSQFKYIKIASTQFDIIKPKMPHGREPDRRSSPVYNERVLK